MSSYEGTGTLYNTDGHDSGKHVCSIQPIASAASLHTALEMNQISAQYMIGLMQKKKHRNRGARP